MRRTLKRLIVIYVTWFIISYFIFENLLKPYLVEWQWAFAILSIVLIIKDINDIKGNKDSWPKAEYWDHAPLSVIVVIFYLNINPTISILAGIDAALDIYDDIKKLR